MTVLNRQRSIAVNARGLVSFLQQVERCVPAGTAANLAVCLVSDSRMREFNRRFRGRDVPTDVLSFPTGEGPPSGDERYLGDIMISVPAARRQARAAEHSLARELKILALHGYLHLLGYDHETDGGKMMRLQRRLVTRLLPRRPQRSAG